MTSKQVLLTFAMLVSAAMVLAASGCALLRPDEQALVSPYDHRQIWAVAPLRNESGSLQVDGARLADKLAQTLEQTSGLDVLAVNRVLATMDRLEMPAVSSREDAAKLVKAMDVDGLVVGVVTAYEPYDPPTLGMSLELYAGSRMEPTPVDLRGLTRASTDAMTQPRDAQPGGDQPLSMVSAVYDAASPATRRALLEYAEPRGTHEDSDQSVFRLYRISMDLYSEFVSHQMCSRLLEVEANRIAPPPPPPGDQQSRQTDRLTSNDPAS